MIALRRMRLPIAAWLALVAAAAWGWARIPGDARVPIHWNIRGEVDNYASKPFALLSLVVVGGVTTLLIAVLPTIDPRGRNLRQSATAVVATATVTNALLFVVEIFIILNATGRDTDPSRVIAPALGGVFMVIGNYLPKTGSNYFIGIRTPWTLSSDHVWRRTHQLGGRMFFAFGAVAIAVGFLWPGIAGYVVAGGALGVAAATALYSYWVWKEERPADDADAEPGTA